MPVFFFIDPDFANDPAMKGIDTITLSYTFFSKSSDQTNDEVGTLWLINLKQRRDMMTTVS